MIYLSVCTFLLYKKLEEASKQRTSFPVLYEVAAVGPDPSCTTIQNVPQATVEPKSKAEKQPPNYQDQSEANQLPSYDSVVLSTPH